MQSPGWLQDPCWSSQRHLKSKFILEAEMLRTQPKNLAKQGRYSQPRVSWLPGNRRWAQQDTDDGFCHLLSCCPLLEGTSGEYVIGPFFNAPTETGIVNPNSPGHVLLFSHVRGATSTATPWGKVPHPRPRHGAVQEDCTDSLKRDPSRTAGLPTHHNPPRAHQRHRPERDKKNPKELETQRTVAPE